LELDRGSQCLPCRAEHAQRLVTAEFEEFALELGHRIPGKVGKPVG
jgi:hypothetical protein